MQTVWLAVAVVATVAAMFMLGIASDSTLLDLVRTMLAVGLVIAGVGGLIVNETRLRRARIVVDLDASRRWVTLLDVHPDFVAACETHEQRHGQRT